MRLFLAVVAILAISTLFNSVGFSHSSTSKVLEHINSCPFCSSEESNPVQCKEANEIMVNFNKERFKFYDK